MLLPKHPWTDQRVEEIVGNLLGGGVIIAAIVVLAGGFCLSYAVWGNSARLSRLPRRTRRFADCFRNRNRCPGTAQS